MPTIESARSWYPASDPVHGFDHVLRVYRLAEQLAQAEGADLEIVRAAALLHDAEGREWRNERGERLVDGGQRTVDSNQPSTHNHQHTAISDKSSARADAQHARPNTPSPIINHQSKINNRLTHHHASSDFGAQVLGAEGWDEARIAAVQHCIRAHRFRDNQEPPHTLEAKILFDADKLDAIGAVGVARAIGYAMQAGQPPYSPPSQQFLESGELAPGEPHSAYHEYLFKLRHLKDRLYTPSAIRIAEERHTIMAEFFERLVDEMGGM